MNNYAKVIQKVKKVNRQAALIMAKKLPLYKVRGLMPDSTGPSKSQPRPTLLSAFTWKDTPQGHVYWKHLHHIID